MGDVKGKIKSLFKRNTTKNFNKKTYVNKVYGGHKKLENPKKKSENKIMKAITDRIKKSLIETRNSM